MQGNLIFKPDGVPGEATQEVQSFFDFERVEKNKTLLFVKRVSSENAIIFYHGNVGMVEHNGEYIKLFDHLGYTIVFVEYRSYVDENITPSFNSLREDTINVIDWLKENEYKNIVVVGRSLGTTVASIHTKNSSDLGSDVLGTILISPPSSILDVAKEQYPYIPISLLLYENVSNIEELRNIKTPVLIVVGNKDKIVANHFSQKLYESLIATKQYVTIPGAKHNDIVFFSKTESTIKSFIESLISDDELVQ